MINELVILGTGNANALRCYNTCFALRDEKEVFLVDAGGGNGILWQLKQAAIPLEDIHHIFLSHSHTDHVLGMVWVIRMICASMKKGTYEGSLTIYCHSELVNTLKTIVSLTLPGKFTKLVGERVLLQPIEDGECIRILSHKVCFLISGRPRQSSLDSV